MANDHLSSVSDIRHPRDSRRIFACGSTPVAVKNTNSILLAPEPMKKNHLHTDLVHHFRLAFSGVGQLLSPTRDSAASNSQSFRPSHESGSLPCNKTELEELDCHFLIFNRNPPI
jgi:hypothetical protein